MPDLITGRRSRLLVVIAVLLLLASAAIVASSCGSGSPGSAAYTPPAAEDFSNLSWTQAFQKLQAKFSREYAFTEWKGINWKALYNKYQPLIAKAEASNDQKSYYLALRAYMHEMRDGHVGIKPDDPAVQQELAGGGFGLIATKLDNGTVAAPWVKSGGPAGSAGIKPGARILEWGGMPVKQALAETSTVLGPSQPTDARVSYEQQRFLVRAPVGTDKVISFKNPGEAASTTVTLKAIDDGMETLYITDSRSILALRGLPESMVEQRVLPGNVGYVRILSEVDLPQAAPGDHTPTLDLFRKAIFGFIDRKVTGIIVDVRSNSGGSDQMVADFMASFYKDKTFYEYQNYVVPATGNFEIWIADDTTGEYTSPGRGISIEPMSKRYAGPVVALVNNGCVSSGEGVAMGIKNLPNGKVVGFYGTNGSFGMSGDTVKMPGDGMAGLLFCDQLKPHLG
jgi:carboxyl-terminal processing protease